MEKLLTVKDLAKVLRVSEALVYKWVHYEYVPFIKMGTLVRFKWTKVEEWLKKQEKGGRSKYKLSTQEIGL